MLGTELGNRYNKSVKKYKNGSVPHWYYVVVICPACGIIFNICSTTTNFYGFLSSELYVSVN